LLSGWDFPRKGSKDPDPYQCVTDPKKTGKISPDINIQFTMWTKPTSVK